MSTNSLEIFNDGMRRVWGPLSSQLAAEARNKMQQLLQTSPREPWLAALLSTAPPSEELYRDSDHGFVLLAHAEYAGLYRPPHDHGRSWVVYGILQGAIEMGAYVRHDYGDGRNGLVQRDTTILKAGDVRVYLPGDIHDTRCLTNTALLLRFTERDLRIEDRVLGLVTRYVEQDGLWIAPKP